MLDGPKIALIVFVVLLAVLVIGIYIVERRHAKHDHRQGRGVERLPLFGTEQLAIRTYGDAGHAPARRPTTDAVERPERATAAPHRNGSTETPESRPAAGGVAPRSEPWMPPETRPLVQPSRSTGDAQRQSFAPPRVAPAHRVTPPAPIRAAALPNSGFATTPTAEHAIVVAPPAGRHLPGGARLAGNGSAVDLALVEGETLRFGIPTDGTVEFLPGRLEVIAGPDAGREIRFARMLGETDIEVTFGRSEGPSNRHVQILARTVSRRHAVMSLIDQHWQLTNLSATNPVVLNGRVLAGNEVAPLLVEGDRIEMGEVVFVFHET